MAVRCQRLVGLTTGSGGQLVAGIRHSQLLGLPGSLSSGGFEAGLL